MSGARTGADRIWVTGLGAVTALGGTLEETWRRLCLGERGLSRCDLFDTEGQRATLVAEVRAPLRAVAPSEIAWSRTAHLALVAAQEALASTAGAPLDPRASRVGLVVGGTTGGMLENELPICAMFPDAANVTPDPARRSHPLTATADALAAVIGPFARARTLTSACSSGASAIVVGAAWLASGAVDAVLVGGAEALCRLTLTGFNSLGVVDPEPSRPFDRGRRGLNLGEGAGFLLLERERAATARGAAPIAELGGWALGAEAHHVTNPEATGAVASRVIARAIARAGLTAADVDYVNAHGTGTPLNDKAESLALRRALGDEIDRVPVSSSKAQIGHTLGAAGAIEAALSVLAIARGALPPTAGLADPDPDCAVRHVVRTERAEVRAAISNAFGFGGMDSAVLFTRPGLARRSESSRRSVLVTGVAIATPHGLEAGPDVRAAMSPRALPGLDARLGPLDPARARRLDRPSLVAVSASLAALEQAERSGAPIAREEVSTVLATAFGAVQGSAEYVHRLVEKGPRLAPPADFPNLVPSAPAGHAAIYMQLQGPPMAVCDLSASGEAAFLTACELVLAREANGAVAGVAAERSAIIDRVFAPLFGTVRQPRPESGAAWVLEAEDALRARGGRALARVAFADVLPFDAALDLARPKGRVSVFVGEEEERARQLASRSTFAGDPIVVCAHGAGNGEVIGGVALAAAAESVGAGELDAALVLGPRALPWGARGGASGWSYVVLFERAAEDAA